MRIETILRFGAVVLPIILAGCADSLSGLRSVYGDETWSDDGLVATNYERGKHHFAQGRYGLAVKHFQMALARDPDSVEAMNALAASFDRLGRFDVAERLYLRALDQEPSSVQSLNNLGYSYLLQRRYELAMTYLRAAQVRDPASFMIAQNFQKAEAALDLKARSFVAAPVQSGDLLVGARDEDAPDTAEPEQVVHLWAVGVRSDVWIERSKPAVQRLITNPHPDVLLAARDAGVAPALANYRADTAAAALKTQPPPWEIVRGPHAGTTVPGVPEPAAPEPAVPTMPEVARQPDTPMAPRDEPLTWAAPREEVVALVLDDGPTAVQFASLGAKSRPAEQIPALPPIDLQPAAWVEELQPIDVAPALAETQLAAWVEPAQPVAEVPVLQLGIVPTAMVEVSNGTGRLSMAWRMGGFLETEGVPVVRLTNADNYRYQETTVFYRNGWLETARTVSAILPTEVDLQADPDQRADIRIQLGGDLLNFDGELFHAQRKSSSEPSG